MEKTTQGELSKKLLKYGALSAAVLGIADASGQIIYTDIADVTLTPGGTTFVNFDIDANGINDYQLVNSPTAAVILPINPAGTAVAGPNGFIGFVPYYAYPSNLAANTEINANNNVIGSTGTLMFGYNCAFSSDWCGGVTDGYVGLVLDIAGATHYGWMRIDLAANRSSMVIKDYAYNTVAGESIFTGQQTLDVEDNIFNDFSYFLDASKNLNLSTSTSLEDVIIYDYLGKKLEHVTLNSNRATIALSNLNSGIYLAKAFANGQTKSFKILIK